MAAVAKANPFPKNDPARTVPTFFDGVPTNDTAATARGQNIEEIRLGKREISVHYRASMGNTKLKLSAVEKGTARNINTVQKLAALAASIRWSERERKLRLAVKAFAPKTDGPDPS